MIFYSIIGNIPSKRTIKNIIFFKSRRKSMHIILAEIEGQSQDVAK